MLISVVKGKISPHLPVTEELEFYYSARYFSLERNYVRSQSYVQIEFCWCSSILGLTILFRN